MKALPATMGSPSPEVLAAQPGPRIPLGLVGRPGARLPRPGQATSADGVPAQIDLREALAALLAGSDGLGSVRAEIQASWRRSAAVGLIPEGVKASFDPHIPSDGSLVQAACPVLDQLIVDLAGTELAVVMADSQGQVIDRRVINHRLAALLDQIQLAPGFNHAETVVGTNAIGTALAQRKQTVVAGSEHFADALTGVASVGAPILDVSSGRVLGVLDITCFAAEASPLMMPLAARAAREIEQRMLDGARVAERIVLQRFLQERRRATGPLVFITKRTMVTNVAADRVIGTNDELMLRECAAQLQHGDQLDGVQITLRDGTEATVGAEPLLDGLCPVGVLLRLSPLDNGYSADRHSRGDRRAFGWDSLTETECSVTDLIVQGLTNRQVAERLFMSHHTVDYHRRSIFRKLGVRSRVDLTRLAVNQSNERRRSLHQSATPDCGSPLAVP